MGVNIAWTLEGGFNLIKGGISAVKSGFKVAKSWFEVSKVIEQGYTINPSKYEYFFGRVVTGDAHNVTRSADNLRDLTTLGVKNEQDLIKLFNEAITSPTVKTTTNPYGMTAVKNVNIGDKGRLSVGFFYEGGNLTKTPTITSIIPQIFK